MSSKGKEASVTSEPKNRNRRMTTTTTSESENRKRNEILDLISVSQLRKQTSRGTKGALISRSEISMFGAVFLYPRNERNKGESEEPGRRQRMFFKHSTSSSLRLSIFSYSCSSFSFFMLFYTAPL